MLSNNDDKNLQYFQKDLHALTHMDFTALVGNVFFCLFKMDKLRLKENNGMVNMMHADPL